MKVLVEELSDSYNIKVEEYVRFSLQPRPKYLPNFIWKKIIKRLLILDFFKEAQ